MNKNAVVVVGSVNLDLVVTGPRIPSPGETVLGGPLTYRTGGKGANQAVSAHRAGADVTFFGAVGSDEFGVRLIDDLSSTGLGTSHVRRIDDTPSGVAMIVVDAQGENTIMVSAGANDALLPESFRDALDQVLETAGVVVLQCEIPLRTALHAARAARAAGVKVVLNASPLGLGDESQFAQILACTDTLVVNETEARHLGARGETAEELARGLAGTGPTEVVVTLGRAGAVVLTEGEVLHVPAFSVETVDTTGAGDAFCGVLAAELAAGSTMSSAIRVASAAGALTTTAVGAQGATPTRAQIQALVDGEKVHGAL